MTTETTPRKDYPKPSLTADVVAIALGSDGKLRVLLIRRGHDPHRGSWAIPGGFCEPDESVGQAAARELLEETGMEDLRLEQLFTFSAPGRDPRGWVVSVAHIALVPEDRLSEAKGGDDADEARWWPIVDSSDDEPPFRLEEDRDQTGALAFDHDVILATALDRLREKADTLAFGLLPDVFTLGELKRAHDAIFGGRAPTDVETLRDRLAAKGLIHEASGGRSGVPAGEKLYTARGEAPASS